MAAWLRDIDVWVFDLDNTIYDARSDIFPQIDKRMTNYIAQMTGLPWTDANIRRRHYWQHFGATLHGLHHIHGLSPQHFLAYAHDIDYSTITPCPQTKQLISLLPGQKWVFTNGPLEHAHTILQKMDILSLFHDIVGIEHTQYKPKPHRMGFNYLLQQSGYPPHAHAMFEDNIPNLNMAQKFGFRTFHIGEEPVTMHPSWDRCATTLCQHLEWILENLRQQLDAGIASSHGFPS